MNKMFLYKLKDKSSNQNQVRAGQMWQLPVIPAHERQGQDV